MLTVRQFSIQTGFTAPQIRKWLRQGRIPGAYKLTEYGMVVCWLIPLSALTECRPPKMGRPRAGSLNN